MTAHNEEILAARVANMAALIDAATRRLDYGQVEQAVRVLAGKLAGEFGGEELKRFRYTAIPRGGLIVLGMLAYVLDLPRPALAGGEQGGVPLVVVDDISLSGARFGEFLQASGAERIIFAHLFSHPDLRAAILTSETRVEACIAAHDLRDLAPERYPEQADYLAWCARWRQRFKGLRFWIGLPDQVIFPWNEPDRPFWNPTTAQVEDHWRQVAPDRNLKNWTRLGLPPLAEIRPEWRCPDYVAYALSDEGVTLCNLETEHVYGLEGVGAEMWRGLAAYGDVEAVLAHLQTLFDVETGVLRDDLIEFITQLEAGGLLERIK